jgi:hypothetical protein
MTGFLFLGAGILYPVISLWDLLLRDVYQPSGGEVRARDVLQAFDMALSQIGFWMEGWLFPAWYRIVPGQRAVFSGMDTGCTLIKHMNVAIVVLILLSVIALMTRRKRPWFGPAAGMTMGGIFLMSYSGIIAVGRALPRGLGYVLHQNLYYAYTACLAVITAVALATILDKPRPAPGELLATFSTRYSDDLWKLSTRFLMLGLSGFVALNSLFVMRFCHEFRYDFAAPLEQEISRVQAWLCENDRDPHAYFTFSGCRESTSLEWLKPYLKSKADENPSIADALFPVHSFLLNRSRIPDDTPVRITHICREHPTATATSQEGSFGPEGLLDARQPGWHAKSPVRYPQELIVDLAEDKTISSLLFLP